MRPTRSHTGRRRNDATRRAVLAAAVRLLQTPGAAPLSMRAIANEAGVGKQTVYRWWSSPGAVLLEALSGLATERVPVPDTGSLRGDLEAFLCDTFRGMREEWVATTLRGLSREAAADDPAAELLRAFTAHRRAALRGIFDRHRAELAADADLDLLVDQAYGVLWYRILLGHAPLDDASATRLAAGLAVVATVTGLMPVGPDDG